jgi:hypothetical protein
MRYSAAATKRRILRGFVVALILAAIAGYLVTLRMSQSVASSRGSISYWVTVSPILRGVPILAPATPPRYHASAGDKTKPSESSLAYISSTESSQVQSAMDLYLTSKGYRRRDDGAYEKEKSVIWVEAEPILGETPVSVREIR